MADRIRGITVEIGGDTTGLSKALKGVNSEIKDTQSQLKDVERLLKLDPTNTQLLAQKQQLLTKAVGETKSKLDTLKTAEKQVQAQFERGEVSKETYDKLEREIIQTEQSLKSLEKQAASSNAKLNEVSAVLTKVSDASNKVASATKGISAAGGAVVAGLVGIATNAAKAADDLQTMAQRSGFTTDELQKFQYAAEIVDVSADAIISSATKMRKSMVSSSSDTAEAWERLGVRVKGANGQLRDSNEVFYDVLEALGKVKNETERDTLAMQLFGKSADQLAGIIDDGGAALRSLGDEAVRLGIVMDEDTLTALHAFNDEIDKLKAKASAKLMQSGAKALEALSPVLDKIIDKVASLLDKIGRLDAGQIKTIATIAAIVAVISPLAGLIGNTAIAVNSIITLLPKLATALANVNGKAVAIVAVFTLLAGLAIKVGKAWEDMSSLEKIVSVLGLVSAAALTAAIALGAFQSAATLGVAAAGIAAGIVAVIAAVESANKRAKQIPKMAMGGKLSGGQAIVGEAGAELLTVSGGAATVTPMSGAVNGSSYGTTNNYNFYVDNIRTYQQIEQKLENERRTTRMGYVGG